MATRRNRIASLGALTLLGCLLLATLLATRSVAATATNVPAAAEAWYEAAVTGGNEDDPSCQLPTGCAPVALPVVAGEETLQAGASGGRDRARAFVALDLAGLPEGALVTGGTLTLPILQTEDSGSFQPETAQLSACLVLGPIKDVQGGSPDQQPEYSCDTAVNLRYDADAKPPVFTADLAPLAAGLATGGVAIVPSQAAHDSGATFQVAFPTTDNAAEERITANLVYEPAPDFGALPPPVEPVAPVAPPPAAESFDSGDVGTSDPAAPPMLSLDDPVPPAVAPPPQIDTAAPQEPVAAPAAGQTAVQPVAMIPAGYAYPAVWLAPLALAALAGALARALTGEIVLDDAEDPATSPDLLTRLIAAFRPVRPTT